MSNVKEEAPRELDTAELSLIEQRISNERKSTGLAYVFWIFFGGIALHNFYLGRWVLALCEIFFVWVGAVALISGIADDQPLAVGIGLIMLGIAGILYLSDLFTIPRAVRRHQDGLRAKYTLSRWPEVASR